MSFWVVYFYAGLPDQIFVTIVQGENFAVNALYIITPPNKKILSSGTK